MRNYWIAGIIATTAGLFLRTSAIEADAARVEDSVQATADRMIEGCFVYAAEKKLPPLSVAVVDESGTLVSFRRQDGAAPLTADAALLKARTALRARLSTAALGNLLLQDPAVRDASIMLQLTAVPGGVPILRTDKSVRGAIGVSGGEPAQDANCAQRAAIAGRANCCYEDRSQ